MALQPTTPASTPPTASTSSPQGELVCIALPEKFYRCHGFLRQCEIFFAYQPEVYHEEAAKCAFLLSLLTGRALDWESAVWDNDPQVRTSFTHFMSQIQVVFQYPVEGYDLSVQLLKLRQGSESAVDFAVKFRTLTAQSGWNDTSLMAMF